MTTNCAQALATGRLSSFSLPFVDCELPQDPDASMDARGEVVHSCKLFTQIDRLHAYFLSPSMEGPFWRKLRCPCSCSEYQHP